jgi:solute carrier family 25 (adenine nucleotide translocator) protein 4/5/6/31
MGGYDISKSILKLDQNSSIRDRFLVAQVITTSTGTICYPLDTIRRRMMLQAKLQDGSGRPLYNNGFHCLKCILKDEGVRINFINLLFFLLIGIIFIYI